MNLLKLSDAKIEDIDTENHGNNFITDSPKEAFKIAHGTCLAEHGIKQSGEAYALKCSQTQVSLMLDPSERTSLPAWLIPFSKVKHDLMIYLASETKGHYTKPVHHLNLDLQQIMSGILKSLSKVIEHHDDATIIECESEKIFKFAERLRERKN